jgi:hypothetical protein
MSTEASAAAGASGTPLAFLQSIAQSDPSPQALHLLSGEIVSLLKQSTDLCAPYLYAVAKQFPAYHVAISNASVAEAHADNRAVASRENDASQSLSTIVSVRTMRMNIYFCHNTSLPRALIFSFFLVLLKIKDNRVCRESMSTSN